MSRIKVKAEGRQDIWIVTDKDSLKSHIRSKDLKEIHNFIPSGSIMMGADHEVKSVLEDIDKAERLAVFTDSASNMGHSLALISNNKLECYAIGDLIELDLEITIK